MKIDVEWIIVLLIIATYIGFTVWGNLNDGMTMKEKKLLKKYEKELFDNTFKLKIGEWERYCKNGFPLSVQRKIDMSLARGVCLSIEFD